MSFLAAAGGGSSLMGAMNLIGTGASIYSSLKGSGKQSKLANQQAAIAQAQWGYQKQYADMLQGLMKDPSSILKQPGYEFGMQQGIQALTRGMAATGYTGSGNEMIALQQYGQQYAADWLLKQEQLLGQLSGLMGANPIGGLGSSAAGQLAATQLTGQGLGEFGQAMGMYKDMFGGSAFGAPSGLASEQLASGSGIAQGILSEGIPGAYGGGSLASGSSLGAAPIGGESYFTGLSGGFSGGGVAAGTSAEVGTAGTATLAGLGALEAGLPAGAAAAGETAASGILSQGIAGSVGSGSVGGGAAGTGGLSGSGALPGLGLMALAAVVQEPVLHGAATMVENIAGLFGDKSAKATVQNPFTGEMVAEDQPGFNEIKQWQSMQQEANTMIAGAVPSGLSAYAYGYGMTPEQWSQVSKIRTGSNEWLKNTLSHLGG